MKRLLLSTLAAVALTATTAAADDWTGAYVGLNYAIDTNDLTFNSEDVGAFAGYRQDFGTLVAGAEVGASDDLVTLEAQAGLDLGAVLPYAFVGIADAADQDGTTYGVGADAVLGENVLLGVKYTRGEFDTVGSEATTLRLGFKF